jgi:arginyl-tRNA synthetase
VSVAPPGFINIILSDEFIANEAKTMEESERLALPVMDKKTIVVDYGGPNVAKPLHVGHLRAAIIGETLKRLARFLGHNVIGDVHLGDWGRQMGMIISEIKYRQPELVYFDENYDGEYPAESPVTVDELNEIYPTATLKAKESEERMEEVKPIVNRLDKFLNDNDSDWNTTKLLTFFDSDLDEYRTKFRDACKNFYFNLIGFWEKTIEDLNKAIEEKSNNYELIFFVEFMTPKAKLYSFLGKTKHECIEKAITKIKEDGLLIDMQIDNLCEKLYESGYYSLFSTNKKQLNFHLVKIY